jgi:hypothetical protein
MILAGSDIPGLLNRCSADRTVPAAGELQVPKKAKIILSALCVASACVAPVAVLRARMRANRDRVIAHTNSQRALGWCARARTPHN